MKLVAPLKESLAVVDDEAALRRGWQAIRGRRGHTRSRTILFVLVPIAAAIAIVFWLRSGDAGDVRLTTAAGSAMPASVRAGDKPEAIELVDGSKIEIARGGAVTVTDDRRRTPAMRVDAGTAKFALRAPHPWIVDAGPAKVEVTRAVFAVSRSETVVTIEVVEGTLLLDAPSLDPPRRELAGGQRIAVRVVITATAPTAAATPTPATAPTASPMPTTAPTPTAAAQPTATPTPTASPTPAPTPQPAPQSTAKAIPSPSPTRQDPQILTTTTRVDEVASLFASADRARRTGRTSEAVDALRTIVKQHARHAEAPIAAFTLGRVLLDEAKDPSAAAVALERAIQMQLPASLRELAHARLVEAHARAGNRSAAEASAIRYRERFPSGRYHTEVDAWLR